MAITAHNNLHSFNEGVIVHVVLYVIDGIMSEIELMPGLVFVYRHQSMIIIGVTYAD